MHRTFDYVLTEIADYTSAKHDVELNRFANRIQLWFNSRSAIDSARASLLRHSRTILGATPTYSLSRFVPLHDFLRFCVATCSC